MKKETTIVLNTGRRMPLTGIGTWQMSDKPVESLRYALEKGYRMIDTSSDYGTQPAVGEAVNSSLLDREELYIVTKVEENDNGFDASREYIRDMGVSYANLILIHRPPRTGAGVELWQELIEAKKNGFTRDIGVSNYSQEQIDQLIDATGETPAVNQVEWSPFGHDNQLLEFCNNHSIVLQAYSPLTRGKRLDDETLIAVGKEYNKSAAQVMIRWAMQRGVVPLPKANTKAHIEENLSIYDFELNPLHMQQINELNEGYSALGM